MLCGVVGDLYPTGSQVSYTVKNPRFSDFLFVCEAFESARVYSVAERFVVPQHNEVPIRIT